IRDLIVTGVQTCALPICGYLIGSCSDRPIRYQQDMWQRFGIAADFTVLKHRLADIKARFAAGAYYHIGDTDVDDHYATVAGFRRSEERRVGKGWRIGGGA